MADITSAQQIEGKIEQTAEICGSITSGGQITAGLAGTGALDAEITATQEITGAIDQVGEIQGKITLGSSGAEPYSGEYEVSPSEELQKLNTRGKIMTAEVQVNPIPPNYGLITWTGSTLIVS